MTVQRSADPGLSVIQKYVENMSIDRGAREAEVRGFSWWPYRLRQHVTASEPWTDKENGLTLSRVTAETELFRGQLTERTEMALAAFLSMSELSAGIWDATRGLLNLRCSVLVHDENAAGIGNLFCHAAALQMSTAESWADRFATPLGLEIARSSHALNGPRLQADEMVAFRDTIVASVGAGESAFANGDELEECAEFLRAMGLNAARSDEPRMRATIGDLWAQIPFGSGRAREEAGALLRVYAGTRHPELGAGAVVNVLLPPQSLLARPELTSLELNRREAAAADHPHVLGSWANLPVSQDIQATGLVAFLPNFIHGPGVLREFCFQMALRARWVDGLFSKSQE